MNKNSLKIYVGYFIVYMFVIFAIFKYLYSIQNDLDSMWNILKTTFSPVATFTLTTVTIILILFRLDRISKYNIPQVMFMRILYYKQFVALVITIIITGLVALFVLYIRVGIIAFSMDWLLYVILECLLITIGFELFYILSVAIKLMYDLKIGDNVYKILSNAHINDASFLKILSSVEGDISSFHARELVNIMLDEKRNVKLRSSVLTNLNYKKINNIYNFEVKYQLFKLWWSREVVENVKEEFKTTSTTYKPVKHILDDYDNILEKYISEDIKKTTFYKMKKQYLIEELLTEIFNVVEENLDDFENYKLYIFLCDYMNDLVSRVIKSCSDNKSEVVKYYVEYLLTRDDSFSADIWFDIISDKLLDIENNKDDTNIILLKCILNSCKKYTSTLLINNEHGYKLEILDNAKVHAVKCSYNSYVFYHHNDIINESDIKNRITNEIERLRDTNVLQFCKMVLSRKGYRKLGDDMIAVETKYSKRIYDLVLEGNSKINQKLAAGSNEEMLFLTDLNEESGNVYKEKIVLAFQKHLVLLEELLLEDVSKYIEDHVRHNNISYYRSIKLVTAYARINLYEKNCKKSLQFMENMNKEDESIIFENVFNILSQVTLNSNYNLLNPMLFIYLNAVYFSNNNVVNDIKNENVSGIKDILDMFKAVLSEESNIKFDTSTKKLYALLVEGSESLSPVINYKHIISSIETEKFRKKNYVIYGLEFSEIVNNEMFNTALSKNNISNN